MWPIVLAFGTVALFIALATREAKAVPRVLPDRIVPPALPPPRPAPKAEPPPPAPIPRPAVTAPTLPPGCTQRDLDFVKNTVVALSKGTVSLDLLTKAHALALRCFPATAVQLKIALEKARPPVTPGVILNIEELIKAPDNPAEPIPVVEAGPDKGKPFWRMTTIRGNFMAIPNFKPILTNFKALQKMIKTKDDGRLGNRTIKAFIAMMVSRGFEKFPKTQGALAANVVKWTEVIRRNTLPAKVGAGEGTPSDPFRWALPTT